MIGHLGTLRYLPRFPCVSGVLPLQGGSSSVVSTFPTRMMNQTSPALVSSGLVVVSSDISFTGVRVVCCNRIFCGHGSDYCAHHNAHYRGLPIPKALCRCIPNPRACSGRSTPSQKSALCTHVCYSTRLVWRCLSVLHGLVAEVCARSRKIVATCDMCPDG